MGHDGEMGLDLLVLRRVFPVLACLEGEDGDVMPTARNCGLHEGYFPDVRGPRQGEPIRLHHWVNPLLVHSGREHDSCISGDVGQLGHSVLGLHPVSVVLSGFLILEPLVAVIPLCDTSDEFHDPSMSDG